LKKIVKKVKKLKKSRKKGGTGPYLGFLQKRPKNSVFLGFLRVFPLENQGRLTEERPVFFGGIFGGFFEILMIFLQRNNIFL
jgi:hypothetical protein